MLLPFCHHRHHIFSPVFQSRQWYLSGATVQTQGSLVVYIQHPPENNPDDEDDAVGGEDLISGGVLSFQR